MRLTGIPPLWDRMELVSQPTMGYPSLAAYLEKGKPKWFPPKTNKFNRPMRSEPSCRCHKCKELIRLDAAIYGLPPSHGFGQSPDWYCPICSRELDIVRQP